VTMVQFPMKFLDGLGMHDTRDSPSIAKEYDNDDDDTSRLDCFRNAKEQEGRDSLFLLFVCLPEVGVLTRSRVTFIMSVLCCFFFYACWSSELFRASLFCFRLGLRVWI
jgi:hypothetical protein